MKSQCVCTNIKHICCIPDVDVIASDMDFKFCSFFFRDFCFFPVMQLNVTYLLHTYLFDMDVITSDMDFKFCFF